MGGLVHGPRPGLLHVWRGGHGLVSVFTAPDLWLTCCTAHAPLFICCVVDSVVEWLKVIGPDMFEDPRGLDERPIRPQHPPGSTAPSILHWPEVPSGF